MIWLPATLPSGRPRSRRANPPSPGWRWSAASASWTPSAACSTTPARRERVPCSSRARPGIGKTTLLECGSSSGERLHLPDAPGASSRSPRSRYAGLLELLTPVRDLLDEVPERQAEALARRWAGPPPMRRRTGSWSGAATLSLLAAAAEARPGAGARRRPALARPRVGLRHRSSRRGGWTRTPSAFVLTARARRRRASLLHGLPVTGGDRAVRRGRRPAGRPRRRRRGGRAAGRRDRGQPAGPARGVAPARPRPSGSALPRCPTRCRSATGSRSSTSRC